MRSMTTSRTFTEERKKDNAMNIQAMKSLSDEMTNVMPWLQGITSDEQYHEVLDLGVAMLRVIIDQHQLTQSDFKNEIGEKSLVSLILKGERN